MGLRSVLLNVRLAFNFSVLCSKKKRNTDTQLFILSEAGGMFDNSLFDNSFGFVRQFKNGLFKQHVLVHKKSKLEIIEHNQSSINSNFNF